MVIFFSSLCGYAFNWQEDLDKAYNEVEDLRKEPFICISLGHNCGIAKRCSQYNIRCRAAPFDWLVTPFPALYHLLQTDFSDFLNPESLKFIENHIMIDTTNKMHFYHDFQSKLWANGTASKIMGKSENCKADYDNIYQKYCRRVARFYAILNSGIPVFLLRTNLLKDEAFALKELLSLKFPKGNLTLVSLQVNPNGVDQDWGRKDILHFSIGRDGNLHECAKFDHPDFPRVFQALGFFSRLE